MAGDSVLAILETAAGAVTAALAVQEDLGSSLASFLPTGGCGFGSACTWET